MILIHRHRPGTYSNDTDIEANEHACQEYVVLRNYIHSYTLLSTKHLTPEHHLGAYTNGIGYTSQ